MKSGIVGRLLACPILIHITISLQMNDNQVSDWKEVDKLIPLKTLQTLYMERNPIWNDPDEPHRGTCMWVTKIPIYTDVVIPHVVVTRL